MIDIAPQLTEESIQITTGKILGEKLEIMVNCSDSATALLALCQHCHQCGEFREHAARRWQTEGIVQTIWQ
jgi:hypothetical protein